MEDALNELSNGVKELVAANTEICLPGQPVLLALPGAILCLGSGVERRGQQQSVGGTTGEVLVATLCGVLRREPGPLPGSPATYSVQPSTQKRYLPRKGDPVVCTVLKVTGAFYSVSIGAAQPASLGITAFDGATKSNRPRLAVGDVVYAHVETCEPGLTVEVTCCAVGAVAPKDWSTGEALFGPLAGGTVISVPIGFASDLFHGRVSVLSVMGLRCAYEACIGLNGRIWVRGCASSAGGTSEQAVTVAVCECILDSMADAGDEEAVLRRVESFFPTAAAIVA
jgi:exosome complex component RRP40